MFANRYTALIDACSLVSAPKRDLLLTLAEAEFFRVRWSEKILEETNAALIKIFNKRKEPDSISRSAKSIQAMKTAFPEALVELNGKPFVTGLPDENDEHIIMSAIQTQAQSIVTENIKDFPSDILSKFNMDARMADDFIADTIALDIGKAVAKIKMLRSRLQKPEMTPEKYILSLESHGLLETVSILSDHIESI